MYIALILAVIIGAVCAVRLHVAVFSVVLFVLIAGSVCASVVAGYGLVESFVWAAMYAIALEAGYVSVYGVLHGIRIRCARRANEARKLDTGSNHVQD